MIIGRLAKDPAVAQTTTGKTVANFTVACSEKVKGEDKVEYINCVAWEKLAENIQAYTVKGSQVFVEGKFTTRKYEDDKGITRWVTEVLAYKVDFLSHKTNNVVNSMGNVEKNNPDVDFSDDCPF